MAKEIIAIFNGIKRTKRDIESVSKKEYEFYVLATGNTFRFKEIKLFQKASLEIGKQYQVGFEDEYFSLPSSIAADGVIYYRESGNRIMSIDEKGNKKNHSDSPINKSMGQQFRAYNQKLIAEGKQPIKPIKKRY